MFGLIKNASIKAQKANIDRSIQRICLVAESVEKSGNLNQQSIDKILSRMDSIQSDFIGPMSQREIRTNCFDPVLSSDGSVFKKELLLYSLYSGKLKNEFTAEDVELLDNRDSQSSIKMTPTALLNGLLYDCFKSALQLNGFYSFSKINNEFAQLAYLAAKGAFERDHNGTITPDLGVINFIALKYLTDLETKGSDYLMLKVEQDTKKFRISNVIPKEYLAKKLFLKPYAFYDFNKYFFKKWQ